MKKLKTLLLTEKAPELGIFLVSGYEVYGDTTVEVICISYFFTDNRPLSRWRDILKHLFYRKKKFTMKFVISQFVKL
jgi:hypothetical protein